MNHLLPLFCIRYPDLSFETYDNLKIICSLNLYFLLFNYRTRHWDNFMIYDPEPAPLSLICLLNMNLRDSYLAQSYVHLVLLHPLISQFNADNLLPIKLFETYWVQIGNNMPLWGCIWSNVMSLHGSYPPSEVDVVPSSHLLFLFDLFYYLFQLFNVVRILW